MPFITVQLETPDQPEVRALIAALDAYQDTLYPPEARYALDLSALAQAGVLFAVARGAEGQALGCGAVVLSGAVAPEHPSGDQGELKRMFVQPALRGLGVAGRVLAALEAAAMARGCRWLQLETGPRQPEAIAFYAKHGFERCGAFGDYAEHPLSVFMRKALPGPPAGGSSPL